MIVTVARDEAFRLRVTAALRDTRWSSTVTNVTSVGEVQQLLESSTVPSVILVGPGLGLSAVTEVVDAAVGLRTPPPVMLFAQPETDVLRSAMRAGVRDVLPPDFETEDLVRAFEDARVSSEGPPSLPGLTVAVFSTKGGVGTSVIASNLAVRLAHRTGQPATLIDLDLASADQAIMHGLSPRWTIQDLADGAVGLDAESMRQVLIDIPGARSRLLPGPIDPALAETITAANVASVVSAARAESPVAVLDTASSFDDRTLAALDAADSIVVVSSLDVAALRSLTVSLQTLERLGIGRDRVTVTVARSDSKSGLTVADVERSVDCSVDVGIPSTRSVPRSVNEGVPLAISSHRSSVVSAIDELVGHVLRHAPAELARSADEVEEDSRRSGGLFPWSRSRGSSEEQHEAQEPGSGEPEPQLQPEVDDVPVTTDEDESESQPGEGSGAEVLSLRERLAEAEAVQHDRPVRRVTRRQVDAPESRDRDDQPDGGEPEGTSEPPPLEAMPPPTVVDDEDDELRRRRGR